MKSLPGRMAHEGISRTFSDALMAGTVAALLSAGVAAWCGHRQRGHAAGPINAVSHIARGGSAESQARKDGPNTIVGWLLHHGASVFWAAGFETFFGRSAERSLRNALLGGATTAATAYVVDYHLVPDRFVPGFEARLSNRALFYVYAALGAGLTLTARMRTKASPALPPSDKKCR